MGLNVSNRLNVSIFSITKALEIHLNDFGISFLLLFSAHSGRKFVFLYYCYLLSVCAHFKNLERFTMCMFRLSALLLSAHFFPNASCALSKRLLYLGFEELEKIRISVK